MKDRLLELGTHVVEYAEKHGANQVEAYLESSRIIEVKIEKGVIRLAAEKFDVGCGVRVAIGNQLGVSYVTSILEKDLEIASHDALNAARTSVYDPDFKSFSSIKSSYSNVRGLFDKQLDQMDCEQAVELITRGVQASLEISGKERNLIEGGFTAESKTRVIVNSNEVNGTSIETKTELDVTSAIGTGEDLCSSWEIKDSRFLADIDPEKVGAKSAQNALALRGAKSIDGGDMPLILSPRAIWAVIGTGFGKALDARQVQEGKSYLGDSIGSEIASIELQITDNGILESGLGSRPFDAEGYPSQNTPLIDSGILLNYLHDSYSSAKDNMDSTGNANRSSYRATPSIGTTNLVVTPGDSTLDEMISEVKRGVLCTFTFDRPNFVTGELSAMVMEGFLISKGETQHALKSTLFGTTMQDLLKKIIVIGSEVVSWENIVSPPILVDSVKITSG